MSSYLEEDSSGNEEDIKVECKLSEEEVKTVNDKCLILKTEGNELFNAKDYENALVKYTEIIKLLKSSNLPLDDVILCNRSATYMALKRYVPASHDALQASKINNDNWKAYYRHGISLMNLSKKRFRTKQAITSFEKCLKCTSLPNNKIQEINNELKKANARFEQQDAEVIIIYFIFY